MTTTFSRPSVREIFGLDPLVPALRGMALAIRGDARMPASRWGLSSVGIFKPAISLPTWLGRRRRDRRIPLYNLYNHVPAPRELGYSVKRTVARDFRGGRLTYDGHVGTDFAVPVGTEVVAPAPGRVCWISNDMQRGGLKVWVDHGRGLISNSHHMARSLCQVGDAVQRGQTVGLSGMSGVDGVLFFPWLAPHVHFNVLLDGTPVDPFGSDGEVALWRDGNDPKPAARPDGQAGGAVAAGIDEGQFDDAAVADGIAACTDDELRRQLETEDDPYQRAIQLIFARLIYPPLFRSCDNIYTEVHGREPHLDLPFSADDFSGVMFPDASSS